MFHGVLHAASGALSLTSYLLGFAFGLELGVACYLTRGFFHGAFSLFGGTFDAVFIHLSQLLIGLGEINAQTSEGSD